MEALWKCIPNAGRNRFGQTPVLTDLLHRHCVFLPCKHFCMHRFGGNLGSLILWQRNLHPDAGITDAETPDTSLKLAVFCTAPAIRSVTANLISEIIGTFVLVFVAGAIFAKAVAKEGPAAGLGPYLVGCLVWAIGLSLGGTTGYAINPARDLGPRIAHAVLPISGKGKSDWGYAGIPLFGPLIGATIAGVLIRLVHL